jgi:hypothetical protein
MSKSNCNKTSNNKYFDCPARMDDGRIFTDYRPSSSLNDEIRYSNNIMSSFEYRQFLINNGNKIIEMSNNYIKEKAGSNNCDYKSPPFQNECIINSIGSKCSIVNANGIGLNNKVSNK